MSSYLFTLRLPNRLGLRLFLLLTVAIVGISTAADAWRLRQEQARVLTQLQREASLVTRAIEGQVAPFLEAALDQRLVGLLEDIRQAKGAECVGVYNLEGRRLQAAFEPGTPDRSPDVCPSVIIPQPVAEAVSAQWSGSGTYSLQVSVTPNGTPQGILKLVFDAGRVSGPLQEFRNSLLVERGSVLLALGVTLWIGIALMVTRPIGRLIAGAEAVGRGNLHARISSPGSTEIGELAQAFNRMASRLGEAQEERRRTEATRAVLERQLRHAERLAAVGKLASVIAHEVGTPLHVIGRRARSLADRLPMGDPGQGDVEGIREQVGRITRTMQRVLQSSRVISTRREPVDPGQLARDVAAVIAPEYAARAVELALALPTDLPKIDADADGLTQVLLNLLSNALAATPNGGRVEIAGSALPRDGRQGVALYVADTGMGIPPENLERIFDPFFSTKRSGGTGLGLSICRDIVRAHHGILTAESVPGAGARFTVWLPGDRREASGA